jgi:hypothetical protein
MGRSPLELWAWLALCAACATDADCARSARCVRTSDRIGLCAEAPQL